MYGWRRWTVHHPMIFWGCLISLMIILGMTLPADPLFFVAGIVSGAVWHTRAAVMLTRRESSKAVSSTPATPPLSLPEVPHVLLPQGQKIQVTKEEHYPEALEELLADGEERHMAATLHRLPPTSPRSTKERVEVQIDGDTVGELTVYMSQHFLPLIRVCEEHDVTVACHAQVKGNQLKADVVLDAVKAIDLSDEWINDHVLGGRGELPESSSPE